MSKFEDILSEEEKQRIIESLNREKPTLDKPLPTPVPGNQVMEDIGMSGARPSSYPQLSKLFKPKDAMYKAYSKGGAAPEVPAFDREGGLLDSSPSEIVGGAIDFTADPASWLGGLPISAAKAGIQSIAKKGMSAPVPAFKEIQQMMQVGNKNLPVKNTAEGLQQLRKLEAAGEVLPSKYGRVMVRDAKPVSKPIDNKTEKILRSEPLNEMVVPNQLEDAIKQIPEINAIIANPNRGKTVPVDEFEEYIRLKNLMEQSKKKVPDMINHGISEADEFAKAVNSARKHSPLHEQNITAYSPEEYAKMRTYLSADKKSGYAIKPDGELVSVFSTVKGRGDNLVSQAVENGAIHGDAYDIGGKLPDLYGRHGLNVVKREPNWNKGGPDVVYFRKSDKK